MEELYGDHGVGKVSDNFVLKYWNVETKAFILKVGRENEKLVTNTLILMNEINHLPCRIRILDVSGTLFKIETKLKLKSESFE